jgi:hypothetical protein
MTFAEHGTHILGLMYGTYDADMDSALLFRRLINAFF